MPAAHPRARARLGAVSSAVLAGVALLSVTPTALADPLDPDAPPTETIVRYRRGLYVRTVIGLGYGLGESNAPTFGKASSGAALQLDFAVGGVVASELAVTVDAFGTWVVRPQPAFVVDGVSSELRVDRPRLVVGALGVGVSYDVWPQDIVLATAIGAAFGSINLAVHGSDDRSAERVGFGFAGQVLIGKEWALSKRTSFGGALQFMDYWLPQEGERAPWNVYQVGAVLSFVYN